jgi:bacillithiol biosynthesis cysteine-adding enzyme BshC
LDTNFQSQYIPYSQTGKFSKIALNFIDEGPELKEFYQHPVSIEGIKSAISERINFNNNRKLLVEQFQNQYKDLNDCDLVKLNISGLLEEDTFTICTAHQPNIFTGHLYFIYKILHVIKLSDSLRRELPEYNFVPVFFMGSEDADLEELNNVVIDGEKYVWETKQTGAVGRMKVDENLIKLIDKISGRLSVEKFGSEIIRLLKTCFIKNTSIEEATFLFVHHLFKQYGLLILLPDSAVLKREMLSIFEDDIFNHTSSEIVTKTSEKLAEKYKVQAYPREINLFYLKDNLRSRIVPVEDHFVIHNTDIVFTRDQMKAELEAHPERFSPNVILRGLFQEIILPNIIFVGGGGELAYWLQLKNLFKNYQVPYPVLILRNSFLIVDEKNQKRLDKLNISAVDLFDGKQTLFDKIIYKESNSVLQLESEKAAIKNLYEKIKSVVKEIDKTLQEHASALETKELNALSNLEKKMLRAEKRKFVAQKNQLTKLFAALFPNDGLQERTDNFMLFYSRLGPALFEILLNNSLTTEQQFCVITQQERLAF